MGVGHHHAGDVVDVPLDEVGRLASHPGQAQQVVHPGGHLPPVLLQQHPGGADDVPGLAVVKAAGADELLHLLHRALCEGLQGGEPGVEGGGDLVHPFVGALGGQPHGEEQLIVLLVSQGADAVGVAPLQSLHDGADLLRRFHGHHLGGRGRAPRICTYCIINGRKRRDYFP